MYKCHKIYAGSLLQVLTSLNIYALLQLPAVSCVENGLCNSVEDLSVNCIMCTSCGVFVVPNACSYYKA